MMAVRPVGPIHPPPLQPDATAEQRRRYHAARQRWLDYQENRRLAQQARRRRRNRIIGWVAYAIFVGVSFACALMFTK